MYIHIRQFQVAVTIVALCFLVFCSTPIGHAQVPPGGPGTLISEEMVATPGSITGSGDCGTLNFNLSGVATGPYPAPFFQEQGGWSPSFPKAGTIFNASFQIKSVFGPVVGSKAAPILFKCVKPPAGAPTSVIQGSFKVQYSANPPFQGSSCQMSGTAIVTLVFVIDNASGQIIPQQSSFDEQMLTSTTCAPPVGPPAMVMLQPANAFNPVGTSHTVTATVTDATGHPVPNTTVFFTVTGADSAQGTCMTDQNGMCSFTYQGPQLPGADDITGCAGGGPDVPPCGDATKVWTLPASTPGQVTGGGQIQMPPTDKVTFGFNAQSDGTTTKGNCNVIDHYKRIHIKCDDVQSLVVVGTHATFFGQADQDGVTTNYRIDVDDLADPGAGMDTFKIQTDQGYIAGGFLTVGNITIHH
jgi:hypothetical protein